MNKLNIPELAETNYFIWNLKIKTALSLKRLDLVIPEVKAKGLSKSDSKEWTKKKNCLHKIIPVR